MSELASYQYMPRLKILDIKKLVTIGEENLVRREKKDVLDSRWNLRVVAFLTQILFMYLICFTTRIDERASRTSLT